DHRLVDLPCRLDCGVLGLGEQDAEPLALALGQQAGAGMESAPSLVERIVLLASALVKLLLDPAATVIQSVSSEANDVEGIHDGDRSRQRFADRGLEPRESVHRDHLDAVLPVL